MTLFRFALPLVLVSAIGCHTRYGPKGFGGGYEDYPAGRGVYYVSFSGNGYTSRSAVTQMWHRRCAELCGGASSYEIVSRDGSTDRDFYVSNGQLQTVSKSFAEGYIRCTSTPTVTTKTKRTKPKISREEAARQLATRKHPKFPELGMTPKESKALCKIQGGVQTMKLNSAREESQTGLAEADHATYSCRVGGILVYKGAFRPKDQGFSSVIGYYEGVDVDAVRAKFEERLGPPDSVSMDDGFRYWSWQDRVGVRAYDSGTKVIFKGDPASSGVTASEPNTNVFQAEPTPVADESSQERP